jgi:hypothetical protein
MDNNRLYSYRGFITDWRYEIGGISAGQLLRDGKAKLVKHPGGRVFLEVERGIGKHPSYKVKAGLAKGIQDRFWAKGDWRKESSFDGDGLRRRGYAL